MKVPEPKKLPSGSWHIQMRLNGVSVSVTRPTAKECKRDAAAIKAEHLAGLRKIEKPDEQTLEKAARAYIEKYKGEWSPTTRQGYEKIVANQFPELFKMPIGEIDSDVLDDAVAAECKRKSRRGTPYAPKTVREGYNFIAAVLEANKIKFETPRLPEIKRKPVQILTPQQVFEAVKGTEIELPCLLAMWLTFTISEIRGFTKSKSIRNGQISVVETVVDVDGKPVRKAEAKEVTRARTANIPPYIMQLIDAVDGDVICPLSSQATNKRLTRLLEKKGMPVISFHKLRHISASVGASLGISAQVLQERGGWKTDYTMRTVYTHTFSADRLAADERIDELFVGIVAPEQKK